jgi:hypothetical protein
VSADSRGNRVIELYKLVVEQPQPQRHAEALRG